MPILHHTWSRWSLCQKDKREGNQLSDAPNEKAHSVGPYTILTDGTSAECMTNHRPFIAAKVGVFPCPQSSNTFHRKYVLPIALLRVEEKMVKTVSSVADKAVAAC